MKKAILVLASAALLGFSASAQEFTPSWNVQLRGGVGETIGETKWTDLLSPAADLSIGYQFTPVFGLRANAMGWQAKGAYNDGVTNIYKFNFLQGSVDATFDICNIFNTNVTRLLSPYVYAGAGVLGRFNNDEARALADKGAKFEYLMDHPLISPAVRAGAGFDIRLSDNLKLNVEAGMNALSDKFNTKKNSNRVGPIDCDFQHTALIGIKYSFGKKPAPAPVVVPEPAPAPAPAPVVKPEPKPEPKPVVAPAPVELQENIYFIIGKWNIQASEVAKLDEIAAFMAENSDTKVMLTGHADKATGSASRNLYLSQKRAEAVTSELVKRGVDASRISSEFKGDKENPFATPAENRVTICFVSNK